MSVESPAALTGRFANELNERARLLARAFRERRFKRQPMSTIKCGKFVLDCPAGHPLISLLEIQPFRDVCIGIAAEFVGRKYPGSTMLDIGANIGDTAAVIASHVNNPLILVEASDYFHEILLRNVPKFPNKCEVKKVLVSDGTPITGEFVHWGGTSFFRERTNGSLRPVTQRLSEIGDATTSFVKTDTDGFDFKLLLAGVDWLREVKPAVMLENQIRNAEDLKDVDELFDRLVVAGYTQFVVWDDPGFHMLSTRSVEVLHDLNRYQFNVWRQPGHRSICNYDVLCLHERDSDVFASITEWWRNR